MAHKTNGLRVKEFDIQETFVKMVALREIAYPELKLGFHPPNGGYRMLLEARRLHRLGVKAGVPDWMLPIARHGYSGLAIEFKSEAGKLSASQIAYHHRLILERWLVHVCTDARIAYDHVMLYVSQPS